VPPQCTLVVTALKNEVFGSLGEKQKTKNKSTAMNILVYTPVYLLA
jgi:hypothetical protein